MPERHHRALAEYGPTYLLDVPHEGKGSSVVPGTTLDLPEVFGRSAPVIVEIGSGAGDCAVAAAAARPDVDFVAMEVWRPGVAQTIAKAVHAGVTNLRLVDADAAQALDELFRPGSLHEVWTFFPDPWPKKRHHKRRLVTAEFAEVVARVLEPGGVWRLATDWEDYAWQMLEVVQSATGFTNPHDGFAPRFEGRVMTRFELKGERAERAIRDLEVMRR